MKTIYSIFVLLIFSCFLNSINAQDCDKGFKEIKKQKLDKAYEVFTKIIEKKPEDAGSYYGLAILYIDPSFKSFNAEKAYDNIMKAKTYYNNIQIEKEKNKLIKINITDSAIDSLVIIIESKLLDNVSNQKTIGAYSEYLEKYPNAHNTKDCIIQQHSFAFELAKQTNTIESYNQFIDNYSLAKQKDSAIFLRNLKAFEEAKNANTIYSLDMFIKKYPDAVDNKAAKILRNQLAYEEAKAKGTLEAYNNFIEKYPNADEIKNAKNIVYELALKKAKELNTLESYQEFIQKYSESSHYNDVLLIRDSLAFEKAKSLNTRKAYKDFIKKYPNAYQLKMAQKNLENIKEESYALAQFVSDMYFQIYPSASQLLEFYNLSSEMDICLEKEYIRNSFDCGPMMIINTETNEIIAELPFYPYLKNDEDFYIVPITTSEKTFLRIDGKLLNNRWQDVLPFSEGYAAVKSNGLWGYINKNDMIVIKPQYISVGSFNNGLAPVNIPGKGWGYINKNNQFKIEPKFIKADDFSGEFASVKNFTNGDCCIDTTGNIVNCNRSFNDELKKYLKYYRNGFKVLFEDYKSLITIYNENYLKIFNFTYNGRLINNINEILYQNEPCLIFSIPTYIFDGPNSFIFNKNGIAISNNYISSPEKELIVIGKINKKKYSYGIIDIDGKEVIPLKYEKIGIIKEDRFLIRQENKYGLIDKSGNLLGNTLYDYIGLFVSGIAPVKLNNLWGYIDIDGNIIRDFIYSEANFCRFKKSVAVLAENKKVVIIDFLKNKDKDVITNYTFSNFVYKEYETDGMNYDYKSDKFIVVLHNKYFTGFHLNEKGICIKGCK